MKIKINIELELDEEELKVDARSRNWLCRNYDSHGVETKRWFTNLNNNLSRFDPDKCEGCHRERYQCYDCVNNYMVPDDIWQKEVLPTRGERPVADDYIPVPCRVMLKYYDRHNNK